MNVLVIGGGASGLMAAIAAAWKGAKVTVAEGLDRVGKKILSTGNGRCNLTNLSPEGHYHGDVSFAQAVLERYSPYDAMAFFERLGVTCTVLEEGKVYPRSLQAASVLDALRFEAERLGCDIRCGRKIKSVQKGKQGFVADGFSAQRVIVATGGKAAPSMGSDGSGYALLTAFGHKLEPPYPALVQLKTDPTYPKALQGIKVVAKAAAVVDGKKAQEEEGEILFTDYGLSGPPILQLSGLAAAGNMEIALDLTPEYTYGELLVLLEQRRSVLSGQPLERFFSGFFHNKLGKMALKAAGVGPLSKPVKELSASECKRVASIIKGWRFPVLGTTGFAHAQVTGGGVSALEFYSGTMESRLAKGLYATGEVLNVHGDCGGFNLQWAWATGYLAGSAAGEGTV